MQDMLSINYSPMNGFIKALTWQGNDVCMKTIFRLLERLVLYFEGSPFLRDFSCDFSFILWITSYSQQTLSQTCHELSHSWETSNIASYNIMEEP